MKKIIWFSIYLFTLLLLVGCSQDTPANPSLDHASLPSSSEEELISTVPPVSSSDELEDSRGSSMSEDKSTHTPFSSSDFVDPVAVSAKSGVFKPANPFALDPNGNYELYAYHAPLIAYTKLGSTFWIQQGALQPELEAAIAAINALPPLEKAKSAPSGRALYGLMSVDQDGSYAKVQYFLYDDGFLTVNDDAYQINSEQYHTLKAVMEAGAASNPPVPHWFVYMNPNRVTSIACTNQQGKMQEMKKENLRLAASELRYLEVSDVKTYTPGSKNLENLPFKAVYTFDNGSTYTVYISDITERVHNVVFYVESSDMSYACAYTASGYINSYVQSTQSMIDGPANPRTM